MTKTKDKLSDRHKVSLRIAEIVHLMELDTGPIGGYKGQETGKGKPHVVLMSRPGTLDGVIRVFSSKFIQIKIQSGYSALRSYKGRIWDNVYQSEKDAVTFLTHVGEYEFGKALAVPTK